MGSLFPLFHDCIALVYFILLFENLIMQKKAEKNTMLSVPLCVKEKELFG